MTISPTQGGSIFFKFLPDVDGSTSKTRSPNANAASFEESCMINKLHIKNEIMGIGIVGGGGRRRGTNVCCLVVIVEGHIFKHGIGGRGDIITCEVFLPHAELH